MSTSTTPTSLTDIPSITEDQLRVMHQVCNQFMGVFSQCDTKEGDSPEDIEMLNKGASDTQALVDLGFIKEITEDHVEKVRETNERTGRTWRVFEITPLGRALFQAETSSAIREN